MSHETTFNNTLLTLEPRSLVSQYVNNESTMVHTSSIVEPYARIFVPGHYLFREANSFPRAKLEENCELRRTDNVQGQISGRQDVTVSIRNCPLLLI